MIRYYIKDGKQIEEVNDSSGACWINITPPISTIELESLSESYHIPMDFLVDSLDIDERSRFEKDDDCTLILINTPMVNEDIQEREAIFITVPIGIIHVNDLIITICSKDNPIIKKFIDGNVKNFDPSHRSHFTLKLLEQTVYSFLASLKKLNNRRNVMERELYNSSRNQELKQLLRIEKSLVYFVNSLSANELVKLKMKRIDLLNIEVDSEEADLFEDIIIDNAQALEMSNVYTNILGGTMEAYASIVSNNQNAFIHQLTIVTITLSVPTLVASLYGMNFKYLPFQNSPYGFYMVILVSILLGIILVWFFRRKIN